jgi:hypothetical protein
MITGLKIQVGRGKYRSISNPAANPFVKEAARVALDSLVVELHFRLNDNALQGQKIADASNDRLLALSYEGAAQAAVLYTKISSLMPSFTVLQRYGRTIYAPPAEADPREMHIALGVLAAHHRFLADNPGLKRDFDAICYEIAKPTRQRDIFAAARIVERMKDELGNFVSSEWVNVYHPDSRVDGGILHLSDPALNAAYVRLLTVMDYALVAREIKPPVDALYGYSTAHLPASEGDLRGYAKNLLRGGMLQDPAPNNDVQLEARREFLNTDEFVLPYMDVILQEIQVPTETQNILGPYVQLVRRPSPKERDRERALASAPTANAA